MSTETDYDRIRRMCSGPSGSSYIEQVPDTVGEPPVFADSEGSFVPASEEVRVARQAKVSELEGNKCMDTGSFFDAIPHFEKAADLSRADGILCQNIAVAWAQLGNTAKAREAISEALRREPDNPRIRSNADALGVSRP
ncbi:tetratricopeptide repeat protein [Gemmatimonadota bacterium]